MRDVNSVLKTAIKALLDPIGYPVYSHYVPASENGNCYILLSDISNVDSPSKTNTDTESSIQIGVYTRSNIANPGSVCDDVSDSIKEILAAKPNSKIDTEPYFQTWSVEPVSDNTQTLQLNSFITINRLLNFRFKLFHR